MPSNALVPFPELALTPTPHTNNRHTRVQKRTLRDHVRVLLLDRFRDRQLHDAIDEVSRLEEQLCPVDDIGSKQLPDLVTHEPLDWWPDCAAD